MIVIYFKLSQGFERTVLSFLWLFCYKNRLKSTEYTGTHNLKEFSIILRNFSEILFYSSLTVKNHAILLIQLSGREQIGIFHHFYNRIAYQYILSIDNKL